MNGIARTSPVSLYSLLSKLVNSAPALVATLLMFLALPVGAQVRPTSGADRLKVTAQKKLAVQQSMVNDQSFRNIGPTIMSGRVVDIDVNPADPTEFYVAYATGGLWHTLNNGQSFNPIFDQEDVLFIGDIAVNWNSKDTSDRIIWVGTGEVNSSRSSYAGVGMYKSMNGGKSWDYLGLPESHHIGKVLLHPSDKNTAWVAVLGHLFSGNKERGVFKTTDGGKSWKQTLYIDDNTGVVDMDLDPSDPKTVYAAGWYRTRTAWNFEEGGASGGIFKSSDGGLTWTKMNIAGSGFPTGSGLGRIGIAVAYSNPSVVYAVLDNNQHQPDTAKRKIDSSSYELDSLKVLTATQFEALNSSRIDTFLKKNGLREYKAEWIKKEVKAGRLKPTVLYDYFVNENTDRSTPVIGCELYRSDDAGKTWRKTNEKPIRIFSSYGYYFGKVFVNESDPNRVALTGLSIELSKDGGKTFTSIDKGNVHSDHHVLWMNPKRPQHIINGNDGGINITYDDGAHWFFANTPAVGQFYSIAVDNADPYFVYGGLQDNGTWAGPSNHKESIDWTADGVYAYKRLGGGDGMQVQVDTRDNNTLYSGSQYGYYARSRKSGGDYKSIHPDPALGESAYRYNWQTPIHLSIHNQDILYYGSNHFHRSMNRGDSIQTLGPDLTNGLKKGDVPFATLTTIHESPLRFGLIYAGSDDGNVQLSKDGGNSWTKISDKLPQGLYVSRVQASAFKESRVYVTLNGYRNDHFLPYVFVSEDYGTNWKSIGMNLPFEPVNVIREDPRYDSVLYVGTDGGVYVSLNAGKSFMSWNSGLPKAVPVHDIVIQQRENEIVLGTHGRSLYIARLDSVHALITKPEYREKKQAEVNRTLAVANGNMNLFNREGIEVSCPPLKRKKQP